MDVLMTEESAVSFGSRQIEKAGRGYLCVRGSDAKECEAKYLGYRFQEEWALREGNDSFFRHVR